MTLGEKIRQARVAAGIGQGWLAAQVGISQNSMHKIETERTPDPHFSHVRKLAEALHLSLDAMTLDLDYPAPRRRTLRA